MKKVVVVFIILGLFGLASTFVSLDTKAVSQNTYYVATSGDNSNPGTENLPWRTIQKAADTMSAGETVVVLPGDYSDQKVRVSKSGIAGAPITYQAQGNVKVKGFLVAALYGPTYDTDNADYITIRGFEIVNTEDPVPGVEDWRMGTGIFMEGSHCIIEDNEIHYSTWSGIKLFKQNGNVTVPEGCVVKNNLLYQNGMSGIEVAGRNNLIEGNEVWGSLQHHPNNKAKKDVASLDADGMRFFGQGHTIRGNYIHDITFGPQGGDPVTYGTNIDPHIDCFQTWNNVEPTNNVVFEQNICEVLENQAALGNGHGFMLESASNIIIRNNIIQAYGGINTGAGGNSHLTIVNNVFANDLSFQYHPGGIGLESSPYSVVKNNIFYNQPYHTIVAVGNTTGQEIDYNLAYKSDGLSADCFRVGDYVCQNPAPLHDIWDIDPLFVDPASGDFHLRKNSPAVDAGAVLVEVDSDFDGNIRPQGEGFDIGPFEFISSSPTPTPVVEPINTPSPIPTLTPTPVLILGDTDGDGDVDIFDYNQLVSYFGQDFAEADFNNNGVVDIFDYNTLVTNFGNIPLPTPIPTSTPVTTSAPTSTPSPTPTLVPTSSPTPTPSPTPIVNGSYGCSHVIGFSQTSQWWSGFESGVDNPSWELKWRSYGAIERWADPNSDFWNTNVMSNCSQNSSWNAERVVLTITGCPTDRAGACPPGTTEKVVAQDWVEDIEKAIANIISKYPRVRRIDLQPVVGGPNNQVCSLGGNEVRASRNHPVVDEAISIVVAQDTTGLVRAGYSPEVLSCSGFSDVLGHITSSAGWSVGIRIGEHYQSSY